MEKKNFIHTWLPGVCLFLRGAVLHRAPILSSLCFVMYFNAAKLQLLLKSNSRSNENWTSSSCTVRAAGSLCSGSSSSPVIWPLTVMLNCFWEEGFFSASLSLRMPLPSHSPSFSRCHILPHRPWCFFSASPLPSTPYPSLCDWLLFDNWPLLVLLFEPTIV